MKRIISIAVAIALCLSLLYVPKIDSKAASIEVNFAKLLQESLYFYDANMCGQDVSARSAFSWRANCHAADQNVTIFPNTSYARTVNVSGGFHDAGDHLKYGLTEAYSATVLGIAYMEYGQAFTDTYSDAHFRTIMNHFTEYFERCTVLNDDGSVFSFVYMVSNGPEDHSRWSAPESQNEPRSIYYTSDSNTATDVVSETAAALALQYLNFGDMTALDYSKKLFNYALTHSPSSCAKEGLWDNSTGGYLYDSQSWGDDYALAAALLYKATGDATYINEFNNTKSGAYSNSGYNVWSWFSWDNVSALAEYYGSGDADALYNCANNMYGGMDRSGGYGCLLQWGSARYNCNTQFLGLLSDKAKGQSEWANWSTNQMKYILGDNPQNQCYVVGYNSYSAKYPHHRAASASGDANQYSDSKHTLLGALVGGPKNSNGDYTDSQGDYQCNEVALDYNAGLVAASAALYMIHRNDGVSTNTLMSAADIDAAGCEMRFTYNTSGGTSEGNSGHSGGVANTSGGNGGSAGGSGNASGGSGYNGGGSTGGSGSSSGSSGYNGGSGSSASGSGSSSGVPDNEWINGQWYGSNGDTSYTPQGSWHTNGSGWWYQDSSGWYPWSQWAKIDGKWYYFDYYGYMVSSAWQDGYWLSGSGAWEYDGVGSWGSTSKGWWFGDSTGWYAKNSWQKINGKWYHFNGSGYMETNKKIDGYWVGADGVCQ